MPESYLGEVARVPTVPLRAKPYVHTPLWLSSQEATVQDESS